MIYVATAYPTQNEPVSSISPGIGGKIPLTNTLVDSHGSIIDDTNNRFVVPSELDGFKAIFGINFRTQYTSSTTRINHLYIRKNSTTIAYGSTITRNTRWPRNTLVSTPVILASGDIIEFYVQTGYNLTIDSLSRCWGLFWDELSDIKTSIMRKNSDQVMPDAATDTITLDEIIIDQIGFAEPYNSRFKVTEGTGVLGQSLENYVVFPGCKFNYKNFSGSAVSFGYVMSLDSSPFGVGTQAHLENHTLGETLMSGVNVSNSVLTAPWFVGTSGSYQVLPKENIRFGTATIGSGSYIYTIGFAL